ncbi:MAG: hypothetical protein KAI81_02735 [Candidatus Marinimicrobia bacterium]|nr:hypothetical protein [Candidatus Neomarinimicrobiota bacterium]
MKKLVIVLSLVMLMFGALVGQTLYTDDFEGTLSTDWEVFWAGEDALTIVDMADAPVALATGGAKVAVVQDVNQSYTGIGFNLMGETSAQNYMVEADVYCYTQHPEGSALTGIVAYADSSKNYYVKLVADFGSASMMGGTNNRLRLYNGDFSMATFG